MGEETVGKPARGRPDVERRLGVQRDGEVMQSFFQLEAATAHVTRHWLKMYPRVGIDETAGFGHGLIVDKHFTREDSAPAFLPAADQPAIHQHEI